MEWLEEIRGGLFLLLIGRVGFITLRGLKSRKSNFLKAPVPGAFITKSSSRIVFKPEPIILFKRFIWITAGLLMLTLSALNSRMEFFIFSLIGFSGYFKLIRRLIHLKDHVTLTSTHSEFNFRSKQHLIDMTNIEKIVLRFEPYKSSITPYFIFYGSNSEEKIEVFEDFFLERTLEMISAMQVLHPEKQFEMSWKNLLTKDEILVLQDGKEYPTGSGSGKDWRL